MESAGEIRGGIWGKMGNLQLKIARKRGEKRGGKCEKLGKAKGKKGQKTLLSE